MTSAPTATTTTAPTPTVAPATGAFFLPLRPKYTVVAYLLLLVLGIAGAHQFYIGNRMRAVTYICTLGGFLGVMVVWDLFTLWHQVRRVNRLRRMGIA